MFQLCLDVKKVLLRLSSQIKSAFHLMMSITLIFHSNDAFPFNGFDTCREIHQNENSGSESSRQKIKERGSSVNFVTRFFDKS